MKHNWKITSIILLMFLITQFIGIYVIYEYSPVKVNVVNPETGEVKQVSYLPEENKLPYGLQPPEEMQSSSGFISVIISFIVAIGLILVLMKYKLKWIIKIWFLLVVTISLWVSLNAFFKNYFDYALLMSIIIAAPLALIKVFKPKVLVHNLTELLVYPGIAAVLVPIFNFWAIIIFLIIISIYDIWAVWHSGIMQKMAKYQMEKVGVFGGFFIPYLTKEIRGKIKNLKSKKSKKKIKIPIAILGGGDIVFPIITAGVFLRAFGIIPALFVIFGAFFGLLWLLINSEKKKFYPAMPFITGGIFLGLVIWAVFTWLV